jgi:hypothetical protein
MSASGRQIRSNPVDKETKLPHMTIQNCRVAGPMKGNRMRNEAVDVAIHNSRSIASTTRSHSKDRTAWATSSSKTIRCIQFRRHFPWNPVGKAAIRTRNTCSEMAGYECSIVENWTSAFRDNKTGISNSGRAVPPAAVE